MKTDNVYMKQLDIGKVLWRHFNMQVFKCQILPDTSSNVYYLETNRGIFALKEYPAGTALETIELEIEVCSTQTLTGCFGKKNHWIRETLFYSLSLDCWLPTIVSFGYTYPEFAMCGTIREIGPFFRRFSYTTQTESGF